MLAPQLNVSTLACIIDCITSHYITLYCIGLNKILVNIYIDRLHNFFIYLCSDRKRLGMQQDIAYSSRYITFTLHWFKHDFSQYIDRLHIYTYIYSDRERLGMQQDIAYSLRYYITLHCIGLNMMLVNIQTGYICTYIYIYVCWSLIAFHWLLILVLAEVNSLRKAHRRGKFGPKSLACCSFYKLSLSFYIYI